jgi:hypothetical protein
MRRVILASAAVVAAIAGALVVLAAVGDEDESVLLDRVFLDCGERVESRPIRPRQPRDTVIGPLAFYRLPENFEPAAQRRGAPEGLAAPPIKALAVVRAGWTVTVSVPPNQREWMRLFYERSAHGGGDGSYSVSFRSCPRVVSQAAGRRACGEMTTACRSGSTQFAGEIYVDYAAAPGRGKCGQAFVRVWGEGRRLRGFLFHPADGECGSIASSLPARAGSSAAELPARQRVAAQALVRLESAARDRDAARLCGSAYVFAGGPPAGCERSMKSLFPVFDGFSITVRSIRFAGSAHATALAATVNVDTGGRKRRSPNTTFELARRAGVWRVVFIT